MNRGDSAAVSRPGRSSELDQTVGKRVVTVVPKSDSSLHPTRRSGSRSVNEQVQRARRIRPSHRTQHKDCWARRLLPTSGKPKRIAQCFAYLCLIEVVAERPYLIIHVRLRSVRYPHDLVRHCAVTFLIDATFRRMCTAVPELAEQPPFRTIRQLEIPTHMRCHSLDRLPLQRGTQHGLVNERVRSDRSVWRQVRMEHSSRQIHRAGRGVCKAIAGVELLMSASDTFAPFGRCGVRL